MYYRIKELRETNSLTIKELANKLSISEKLYLEYELGKKEIPVSIISKIARIFNTSIDYIVGDTNEQKSHKKTI